MFNSQHMVHSHGSLGADFIAMLPFIFALVIYLSAVIKSAHSGKNWPIYRIFMWLIGVFCALAAVTGPIAVHAHHDFTAHMLGHLLLGMLAPLLMVLAAPMTLILRTVNVRLARRLSLILRSKFFRFASSPLITSFFNIGGLWLLYCSTLYQEMQNNFALHVVIHIHIFLAGYLFTSSMIYIDPSPHRTSFLYRAIVCATALSGHGILAKYIYAHPPVGVPAEQSKMAGIFMYYGGDVVELVFIIIFCYQWYKSARPVRAVPSYEGQ
ncbi:cytochrome c oxidase assembly protein [Neobacillus vireti]|uniref:cytochrome c oxidase assembly protein n=1 Tax=Neobacillus vireti TaxID=220686 RepID=UPI002FFEE29F